MSLAVTAGPRSSLHAATAARTRRLSRAVIVIHNNNYSNREHIVAIFLRVSRRARQDHLITGSGITTINNACYPASPLLTQTKIHRLHVHVVCPMIGTGVSLRQPKFQKEIDRLPSPCTYFGKSRFFFRNYVVRLRTFSSRRTPRT